MEILNYSQRGIMPFWAFQQKLGTTVTEKLRKLLFGSGQQGVFYVPQPTVDGEQVLFQDSAGTTPVTADGQPVGLMLDLSKGLVRGPELVTNGTFDSDVSGWTESAAASTLTYADGEGRIVTTITNVGIYQSQAVTAGRIYEATADARVVTGSVQMAVADGAFTTLYETAPSQGVGEHTLRLIWTAYGNDDALYIRCPISGTEVYVDNISVRELPGNHATQTTAAAKPLYRTDGALHWLEWDGIDDVIYLINNPEYAATFDVAIAAAWPLDDTFGAFRSRTSTGGFVGLSHHLNVVNPVSTNGASLRVNAQSFTGSSVDLKALVRNNAVGVGQGGTNISGTATPFTHASVRAAGRMYSYIEVEDGFGGNLNSAESYLADLSGVTL